MAIVKKGRWGAMNKNLGLVLLGVFAVISGAVISIILLKNKFKKDEEFVFEDIDGIIDDEEIEHFFGMHDDDLEDEEVEEIEDADLDDEQLL